MPLLQFLHLYGYRINQIISADDPADNAAEMGCACGCGSSGVDGAGSLIGAEYTPRQSYFFIAQLQSVHRAAVGHIDKSAVARVTHIRITG